MTDAELQRIYRGGARDLDARQRAQLQRLKEVQRDIYDELVAALLAVLLIKDGIIQSGRSEASIAREVDRIIDKIERTTFRTFGTEAVRDFREIARNNVAYYGAVNATLPRPRNVKKVEASAMARLKKTLGLGDKWNIVRGGFLFRALTAQSAREEIKATVTSAVASGVSPTQFKRQLALTVKGTRELRGVVEKEYAPLVEETYHHIDRDMSKTIGAGLGFRYFTYEGGLIETSREFCIKKDGKVFTTVEAEAWRHDPDLPRTTKERVSGVITNYVPTVDMGRWRCRHRVRFISPQMARRLAPERFN